MRYKSSERENTIRNAVETTKSWTNDQMDAQMDYQMSDQEIDISLISQRFSVTVSGRPCHLF